MARSFTCLLSVYWAEKPKNLRECLASIRSNTQQPDDVVLVVDGPITEELEDLIVVHRERLPLTVRRLPTNVGLARALNAGLEEVRTEWVARMDTDDVCEPGRFEEQLKYLEDHKGVGLFGGDVLEFIDNINQPCGIKKTPVSHDRIIRLLRWRNPFNHMTVMYRKADVARVGGYPDVYLKEDYLLWIRLAAGGLIMGNTGSVLVRARAGQEMLKRRSGLRYIGAELDLHKELRRCRLATSLGGYDALILRCLLLSAPAGIKARIYRRLLRTPLVA